MIEQSLRMTDRSKEPTGRSVAAWVGEKGFGAWKEIVSFIEKKLSRHFS